MSGEWQARFRQFPEEWLVEAMGEDWRDLTWEEARERIRDGVPVARSRIDQDIADARDKARYARALKARLSEAESSGRVASVAEIADEIATEMYGGHNPMTRAMLRRVERGLAEEDE